MLFNPIDTFSTNMRRDIKTAKFYLDRAKAFKKNNVLDNIYFCTIQKCGSQWINAIFSDKRVQKIIGLAPYPQHHYDINDFRMRFPRGAFVPGLYIDYYLYDLFIKKSDKYKTFFVYRDPRDLVVSWYFSAKETHALNVGVKTQRQRLNHMSQDEGLLYAMNRLAPKFTAIRTWVQMGESDANVKLIKFEDITKNPNDIFSGLFDFFGYHIDASVIQDILHDYSKDKMRKKDIQFRHETSKSHYRMNPSKHQEIFKPVHYDAFYNITGDLIEFIGYKR